MLLYHGLIARNPVFCKVQLHIYCPIEITLQYGLNAQKVPSHWGGSFVHTKHMLWLKNKTVDFKYAILSWDLVHLDSESSALPNTARIVSRFHWWMLWHAWLTFFTFSLVTSTNMSRAFSAVSFGVLVASISWSCFRKLASPNIFLMQPQSWNNKK